MLRLLLVLAGLVAVLLLLGIRPASSSISTAAATTTKTNHHQIRQFLDDGNNNNHNNQTAALEEEEEHMSFFAFLSQWMQMDPEGLYGGDSSSNNSTTIPDGDDDVDAEGNQIQPLLCIVALPVYYVVGVPLELLYDALQPVGLDFLLFPLFVPLAPFLIFGQICSA